MISSLCAGLLWLHSALPCIFFLVMEWPEFVLSQIFVACVTNIRGSASAASDTMNDYRRKRHSTSVKSRLDHGDQQRCGLQNTGAQRPRSLHTNVSWHGELAVCLFVAAHYTPTQADLFCVFFPPPQAHHPKIAYTGTCCPIYNTPCLGRQPKEHRYTELPLQIKTVSWVPLNYMHGCVLVFRKTHSILWFILSSYFHSLRQKTLKAKAGAYTWPLFQHRQVWCLHLLYTNQSVHGICLNGMDYSFKCSKYVVFSIIYFIKYGLLVQLII